MRTQEEIRRFIQFRADGLSYEKAAKRLGISKWTLMNWGSKYESEIAELKAARLEALREQYCLSVEAKVQMWGKIVNEVKAELDSRKLYKVSPDKLLDMLIKAQNRLDQSYIAPESRSEDATEQEKQSQNTTCGHQSDESNSM